MRRPQSDREWRNVTINGDAFTIIELLVVIAIVAILVGLLLPTLGRARHGAEMTACKKNLRQLNLGLSLYAADFDAYPRGLVPHTARPLGDRWFHQLEGYLKTPWPDGGVEGKPPPHPPASVWVCPSFRRIGGFFQRGDGPNDWARGRYGYNDVGPTPSAKDFAGHGLGGRPERFSNNRLETLLPAVRPAQVVNPTRMIALGDTPFYPFDFFSGPDPFPQWRGRVSGEVDLSDGLRNAVITYLEAREIPTPPGPPASLIENQRKWLRKRHYRWWNLAFGDGHVEPLKAKDFFRNDRRAQLELWNADNKAHFELY